MSGKTQLPYSPARILCAVQMIQTFSWHSRTSVGLLQCSATECSKPDIHQSGQLRSSIPAHWNLGTKYGHSWKPSKSPLKQYMKPTKISALMPRPGLMLAGRAASAAMLLEQAVWSHSTKISDREVGAEVFVRWVNEGGLSSSFWEVLEISTRHSEERISMKRTLVHGPKQ